MDLNRVPTGNKSYKRKNVNARRTSLEFNVCSEMRGCSRITPNTYVRWLEDISGFAMIA